MSTPTHAATGHKKLALTVAAAILLPLRLALYEASQPRLSRPMAAVTLPPVELVVPLASRRAA